MKHAAIIQMNLKSLLHMLDFEGGTISIVYMPDYPQKPECCNIVIEHPDLPEVVDNTKLSVIQPTFRMELGDNGVIIKVERIDPPKQTLDKSQFTHTRLL